MSAFLGKIHYWLYNKIQLHENLIQEISLLSSDKGHNINNLISESIDRFGPKAEGDLEGQIDHGNIHGWLQERITSVESRLAYISTKAIDEKFLTTSEIAKVFYENGKKTMLKLNLLNPSIEEIYNSIYDYMLEGMPCDRVNEVLQSDEDKIVWNLKIDIHKKYWDAVIGDINNFNTFRVSWIEGFLSDTNYKYSKLESGINQIERR